ncbi:MAG: hypothetical protein HGA38_00995 [Candidatus Moranbacteria bacterium]|nr:hypothetical protein [Candidatus Moranbacteria bacterium]
MVEGSFTGSINHNPKKEYLMERGFSAEQRSVYELDRTLELEVRRQLGRYRVPETAKTRHLRNFPNDPEITYSDSVLVPLITDGRNRIVPLAAGFDSDPLIETRGPSLHIPILDLRGLKKKVGAVCIGTVRKIIISTREIRQPESLQIIEYILQDVQPTGSGLITGFFRRDSDLIQEERQLFSHGIHLLTFVRQYLTDGIPSHALDRLPQWDDARQRVRQIHCTRLPDFSDKSVRRRVLDQVNGKEPALVPV